MIKIKEGAAMMYKTILVHVDDGARSAERVRVAAAIAGPAGGHLIGAALSGVSRFLYQKRPPEAHDPTLVLHLEFLRERARLALAAFAGQMKDSGVSFESRLIDDEPGGGLSLHARAADLVLLDQADPQHSSALMADVPAYVLMHAARPVLILPFAGSVAQVGKRILVSWDASKEAARALTAALPMLAQAEAVTIAVFDTGTDSAMVADALAADPVPMLARHGIKAELALHTVEARRGPHRRHEVGDALLSLADEVGADLLVMGAYGHSRFRETILGGVTRTVFDAMTIPVLMAH
jgi:nucleotide-binding universal stress UspA family protein